MNCLKKVAVAVSLAFIVAALVPAVKADDVSWPTVVSFTEPVQIGSIVFPPGSYLIKRNAYAVTSSVLMIYSLDRNRWEGIIQGIHARRSTDAKTSVLTFERQGEGKPEALQYWFYQDWSTGMEFPYHHIKASPVAQTRQHTRTIVAQSNR